MPFAERPTSTQPVNRPLEFHSLSPWRSSTRVPMRASLAAAEGGDRGRRSHEREHERSGPRQAPPEISREHAQGGLGWLRLCPWCPSASRGGSPLSAFTHLRSTSPAPATRAA